MLPTCQIGASLMRLKDDGIDPLPSAEEIGRDLELMSEEIAQQASFDPQDVGRHVHSTSPKRYPIRPGDSYKMQQAIRALRDQGFYVRRPDSIQLKIEAGLNFWPETGSITRDGGPRIKEKGLDAFLRIALAERKRPVATPAANRKAAISLTIK